MESMFQYARSYVDTHQEQIEYMEHAVVSILDRNYDLLYDYFCNVLERDEEYKILRARRCQVLFRVFLLIILKNEPNIPVHGTFISDHAIPKYRDQILGTTALILDDIVIHGRGLQELYEELDADYTNENIHVYVHKMARSASIMTAQMKKKTECDAKVFDWEWRELSTQLVNVIQATVTSYVSYVESYISFECMDMAGMQTDFELQENTNEDQKRVGTRAFVLFEKEKLPPIICNGGYDACIRYYENRRIGRAVYVPYVFLKAVSGEDIKRFFDVLKPHLGDGFTDLRQELMLEEESVSILKYKAYLVNVLLNRIYGLYLENKYQGLFAFSDAERLTLSMCFGETVAEEIGRLRYDDICGLLNEEFCQTQYDMEGREDQQLFEGLDRALQYRGSQDDEEIFSLYFFYNRQVDEESVKRREKRKKGLSIQTFYNKLGDVHHSSKMQLKCWDEGRASCDLEVIGQKIVCAFSRAGEQSFRYIVNQIEGGSREFEQNIEASAGLKREILQQFFEANSTCLCEWHLPKIYC